MSLCPADRTDPSKEVTLREAPCSCASFVYERRTCREWCRSGTLWCTCLEKTASPNELLCFTLNKRGATDIVPGKPPSVPERMVL